ncbi:hypothetical protein CEXT_400701 [Caerostris extrusa]|uniref:Uncharacterized protein n=1 Tax=Caerostris extrusa TaxID=172846 RepID=A0AAV4TRD8_CAEEX|nr:hypothetical protein CEXT_400701 [Caerostris extrusa]
MGGSRRSYYSGAGRSTTATITKKRVRPPPPGGPLHHFPALRFPGGERRGRLRARASGHQVAEEAMESGVEAAVQVMILAPRNVTNRKCSFNSLRLVMANLQQSLITTLLDSLG